MKSKRVPDRVHVVRTPEQENNKPKKTTSPLSESREIVLMLAQISDKLKRSEAERYKLLSELREYRSSIDELKTKTDHSDQAFQELESRLATSGVGDGNISARQTKFEKTLKDTEEKMVKAIAGQALIDKRLQDTEEKQMMIHQQIEKSMDDQKKIEHQIEMNVQDKSRLLRKMERLEDMMNDTQSTLQAKAMVLLTDKSTNAKAKLQAPAWGAGSPEEGEDIFSADKPTGWKKYMNLQNIGLVCMVIAALLTGWAINQMSKNAINPNQSNAPVTTSLAPQNDISDVQILEAKKVENIFTPVSEAASVDEVSATTAPLPDDVTQLSDSQLLAALNTDPEGLAAQLNNIEPRAAANADKPMEQMAAVDAPAVDITSPIEETPPNKEISLGQESSFSNLDMTVTNQMKNFDALAYSQNKEVEKTILEELQATPSLKNIPIDAGLPDLVKKIEAKAFSGNANAQHDLAAIYTAGQGGVTQDFQKARLWFLKASEKNIPNAQYNLGVLSHQGLGTERNLEKALYWYRESAKLGHAEAQYNLGISHIEGIGTDYDPALAAGFFERAANSGIVEAAYNLGLIHENGLLGNVKLEEAMLWYHIAGKQGNLEAKKAMEQIAKKLQIGTEDIGNFVERMQDINKSVKGKRAGPDLKNDIVGKTNSTKAITAQIQEYLMLSNKYDGPADGINGSKTENAIRAYQKENNMPATGKVSKTLLNHMVSQTLADAQN